MSAIWGVPMDGLGEKVRQLKAEGKLPTGLDVAAIEGAVERFHAFAEKGDPFATKDARGHLEGLIGRADTLADALLRLPLDVLDALQLAMARPQGPSREIIIEARDVLGRLAGALELARREIPHSKGGAPTADYAWLVIELAGVIERAGAVADASKAGPLARLLWLLPAFQNDSAKALNGKIRGALDKRSTSPP